MIHNRQPHFTHAHIHIHSQNDKTRLDCFEKPTDMQVLKTVRVITMIKTKGDTRWKIVIIGTLCSRLHERSDKLFVSKAYENCYSNSLLMDTLTH